MENHPSLRSSTRIPEQETWLHRVRESLAQILAPVRWEPSSVNGAPFHLLRLEKRKLIRAQSLSCACHVAAIAGLLLISTYHRPGDGVAPITDTGKPSPAIFLPGKLSKILGVAKPSGGNGSGGDENPVPPTRGDLAPLSSRQLAPAWMIRNLKPRLPVAATILDPNSPELENPPVVSLGLPWMKDSTGSGGPGGPHGVGNKRGTTMGDGDGDLAGTGTTGGPYHAGLRAPACVYCPDPLYTDEARRAKVQGNITLQVLIGEYGEAQEIRVSRGIGFGLEERAAETVREAGGRGVPVWVTVDVSFRLF